MKFCTGFYAICINRVTSFAEVWIEINFNMDAQTLEEVTSFAEVWIEIDDEIVPFNAEESHFLRGSVD